MFSVTIIGAGGHIGSTTAFSLMLLEDSFHMDLIDTDKQKLRGEISDLIQACGILHKNIDIEEQEIPKESDFYIICCGRSGSDRESLYNDNKNIILPYIKTISRERKENSWILMVSNPSTRLAQLALEYVPQVIPIGNRLDNSRLKLCKATCPHEKPDIQAKYLEVKSGKGYTNFAPVSEIICVLKALGCITNAY